MEIPEIFWDKHPDEIIEFWDRKEPRVTKDRFSLISSFLSKIEYDSLLDIGCGNGNLIKYCKIPSSKYIGVDFAKGMLERLKKNYPDYKVIEANFLDCSPPRADVVIAHSFLEHQLLFWNCIDKLASLAKKALLINVLVKDKGKVEYNPSGYWERVLSLEEFNKLKERLSKSFSIQEIKFYARPERYLLLFRKSNSS